MGGGIGREKAKEKSKESGPERARARHLPGLRVRKAQIDASALVLCGPHGQAGRCALSYRFEFSFSFRLQPKLNFFRLFLSWLAILTREKEEVV